MKEVILFGYSKNAKILAKHLKQKSSIIVYSQNEYDNAKEDGYLDVELCHEKILDDELIQNGIQNVKIAVCSLEDEIQNMFLVLSIKNLNPNIKIIANSRNEEYKHRYEMAGVDQVINPYEVSANRIESILQKPITLEFIHNVVFEDNNMQITQIKILKDCFMDGKYLSELKLNEKFDLIVIGIIDLEKSDELSLVLEDRKLDDGDIIVVMGLKEDIKALREKTKDI